MTKRVYEQIAEGLLEALDVAARISVEGHGSYEAEFETEVPYVGFKGCVSPITQTSAMAVRQSQQITSIEGEAA